MMAFIMDQLNSSQYLTDMKKEEVVEPILNSGTPINESSNTLMGDLKGT
jgi:hypothetical protein